MARFMLTKSIISLRFYRTSLALILGVVLAVGASSALAAAAPTPGASLGNNFIVNTHTAGWQWHASVASDAAGDFVIVWTDSSGQDGDGEGIFARRYLADGTPVGSGFQVNTNTSGDQDSPRVAMSAGGQFVIVWKDEQTGQINSRVYDTDGNALKNSDQKVADDGKNPDVAIDAAGNFVVMYQKGSSPSITIHYYAYDASSDSTNTGTIANGSDPVVAMNSKGAWIVAYKLITGKIQTSGRQSDNTPINSTLIASTNLGVKDADVAMDAEGEFVITWLDKVSASDWDIYARHFSSSGVPDIAAFRVNTITSGIQGNPAVSMDAAGGFIIAWYDWNDLDGDGKGIFAQRYDKNVNAIDSQLGINTNTSGDQTLPDVTMNASGGVVAVWEDRNGYDGDSAGIIGQRYAQMSSVDIETVLSSQPSADIGDSFTLTASVNNLEAVSSLTGVGKIDDVLNKATGLQMSIPLPTDVKFVSATGSNWACSDTGGQLDCNYGALVKASGHTSSVHIKLKSDKAGKQTFQANTYGDQPDATTSNNAAKASVMVQGSSSSGSGGGGGGGAFGWLGLSFVGLLAALRRRRRIASKKC